MLNRPRHNPPYWNDETTRQIWDVQINRHFFAHSVYATGVCVSIGTIWQMWSINVTWTPCNGGSI